MDREDRNIPNWRNRFAVKRFIRARRQAARMRIRAFFILFYCIALIGLLIPLRPKTSELEKRELEKWPSLTWESFWDGSYFSGISTWYADTFPFRELLISANSKFQNLYGLKGEQVIHNSARPETTPAPTPVVTEAPVEEVVDEKEKTSAAVGAEQGEGTIKVIPEQIGDIYVTGDTGFELYYFYQEGADMYIDMIDQVARKLEGISTVYTLEAPSSAGVMLSEETQKKMGISLQTEAIDYVYDGIQERNGSVVCVNAYPNLAEHNDEYIYFRTDHHWTTLGAYYAYEEFCRMKGITPHPLSDFESMEFPGFLGTFYSGSNQAESLEKNPDTVVAYIPMGTNDMTYIGHDGMEYDWHVVEDATGWDPAGIYNCFIGSDEPFGAIENPAVNDGSSIVVIKESYGNAFVPFLVDHYQYTYIVDHRYFYLYSEYGNNLLQLIQDKGIQDVLFLNTTSAMVVPDMIGSMAEMFP